MESGELFTSTGVKNERHGAGQYFTDLTSGYTSGQISRRLLGVPWNSKKLTHFIDVDMSGLKVIKNARHNFLVPGTNSLPLGGRIVNWTKELQRRYSFEYFICQIDNAAKDEYYFDSNGIGKLYKDISR